MDYLLIEMYKNIIKKCLVVIIFFNGLGEIHGMRDFESRGSETLKV